MKNKLKNNKGITLIALIITIVVLLILAVVSINLVINEGFIFKTKDATIKHKVAEIDEALKLKLNEEQIIKSTEKGEEVDLNSLPGVIVWENTPYSTFSILLRDILTVDIPSISQGNIYEKATGKVLFEDLIWIPTELINSEGDILENTFNIPELKSLGIKTNLGINGCLAKVEETGTVQSTDIFVFDKNYNVYYIDENGNIYNGKTKYEADKIYIGAFNPDSLPEEEKKVYYGIYNGALAFTKDEEYAKRIAQNDFDELALTNTFFFDGYNTFTLTRTDGTIAEFEDGTQLKNLAWLRIRPDGSVANYNFGAAPDPKLYYMDSNYNMYEFDTTTKTIKDKEGRTISDLNVLDMGDGVTIEKTHNGYTYNERFDNKSVVITAVPDRENLNMVEDFAGINVYSLQGKLFENKSVKTVILPNTIKTLCFTDISRTMTDTYTFLGVFEKSTNLEQITLSNSIQKLYVDTFKDCKNLKTVIMPDSVDEIGKDSFSGCDGVTVKFKDGKAPAGAPWGGTNLNITSK